MESVCHCTTSTQSTARSQVRKRREKNISIPVDSYGINPTHTELYQEQEVHSIPSMFWPLTPKIDRATWHFLKFDMRHRA